MTTIPTNLPEARTAIKQARHKASPFVEKFARVGYAAKGVVYVVIGALAAFAAVGSGGQTTGSKGALAVIAEQPFGRILLGITALGLAGYAMWQFIRAVEDPEDEGNDGKAMGKRFFFFISGSVHFTLVIFALRIVLGYGNRGGGDDDESARSWSAEALSYPLGRWLLAAIGIGIIGYGFAQLVLALKSNLDKRLHFGQIDSNTRRVVVQVSRLGMAARGVVFAVIGLFLMVAAWQHDSNEAKGLGGALDALARQPYGPWLLGVVALGLIAYGIYEFVKARYRTINPS